jgi:hypothetical protein
LLAGSDTDLQWQYLYHQVYHNGSTQQQLHTQLGKVMVSAIAKHLPGSSGTTSSSPDNQQQQQQQQLVTQAQLAAMVHQLPLLFAPNSAAGADADAQAGVQQQQQRGSSMLFSSAAGQVGLTPSLYSGGALGQVDSLFGSGFGSVVSGAMPSASLLAASVSDLHSRSSTPQQLPVAAVGAAVAAAAHPARASQQHGHQQQHAQLPTVHEQQQRQQQRRQQWHHQGGYGALAGRAVQPRQRLLQQRQASSAFGFLTLSGASAGQQQWSRHEGSRDLAPGAPSGLQHQQQQQQLGHAHSVNRQLSSIAELLMQQQQQGVQAAAAQASAAGASAAKDGAEYQQQQQPSGIRALPAGIGPWPKPPSVSAADADSSSLGVSHEAGAQEDGQAAGVAAGVGSPFAAAAATAAAFDKVLLLRCLLVYHLQASLLYDAEVSAAGG